MPGIQRKSDDIHQLVAEPGSHVGIERNSLNGYLPPHECSGATSRKSSMVKARDSRCGGALIGAS
jgi:hypothetical protein